MFSGIKINAFACDGSFKNVCVKMQKSNFTQRVAGGIVLDA